MKLKIQNGAVDLQGKTILDRINIEITDGNHIAIVGKNGTGKTTLLNAIINNDMLTPGVDDTEFQITKIGKIEIGYLEQIKINENLSLFEELENSFAEILATEKRMEQLENNLDNDKRILEYSNLTDHYKNIGGYTYKKEIELMILKFGFNNSDKDKMIQNFSGGEKMKISFMKLLLSNPDLLLLDEPTNHLDITTIEWLEEYLRRYKKAFIVVSHDRMFLNNIVNVVYDIEYGEIIKYVGNYSKYVDLKKERYDKLLKDYEYQQSEIDRLRKLYEKFRGKPTKAKMALSKLKQIERMEILFKPHKENLKTFKANLSGIPKPGKIVLSANNLSFGYDKELGRIDIEVERGKRIGIIGANGTGKSTLLKTLCSMIKPISGNVKYGYNVKSSYFDQNLSFDTNGTIIEEFYNKYEELTDFEARSALGSFLFTGEDVEKKLSVLSGGEKVRLLLCEVFFSKSNIMFLDEPTNHLDIVGKEKLEKTLKEYPETIIFVSHDRYFVSELADELIVFENNTVNYYRYGYQEYLNKRMESTDSNKIIKKVNKETKIVKVDIKKLEKEITNLTNQISELNKELYKQENYNDYRKVQEIELKIKILDDKIKEKEKEWEDNYE